MKYEGKHPEDKRRSRTPQGVRGLKFFALILALIFLVAPRKGCVD